MSKTSFFYAKISCPRDVNELNFYSLLKKLSTGTLQEHQLYNIPNNLESAKSGDIIILHIGGDSSNKSKYFKQNILPKYSDYKNGIHAIGLILDSIKESKEVKIKVIGLNSSITKNDLYYFPQFINNLGGTTKGTPNQAGLYELEDSIGLSLLDYINLNNLLPAKVEEFNVLNSANQLYENAYKSFQKKFSNKKSTSDLIKRLPEKSNSVIPKKAIIHIKNKFIDWINKEDNYKKSYDGLVTEVVLNFWNRAYFNNLLFLIDIENIDKSISKIEKLILNSVNQEWINYSQATSKGAPMAVLGKNNYLKFLNELSNEIKSDKNLLSKQLTPQIFKTKNFQEACESSKLKYKPELITRYIASLATKPFVLLSGLSGSGKTKLSQAFAQWIAEDESQYCIVPVGADWTNREPLLGYVNALNDEEYILPENGALKLLIEANKEENKNRPYFLILDEMNLSHVERYFADFLSVMESKDKLKLHSSKNDKSDVPSSLSWQKNLFIVGTVNIDETTYMFSPKVLDRANVIEFRVNKEDIANFLNAPKDIDFTNLNYAGASMGEGFINITSNKDFPTTDTTKLNEKLVLFFEELKKTGAEFGYRSAMEIHRLYNQITVLDSSMQEADKIDIAIMQKLLPKLHGSRRKLCPILEVLGGLCVENIDVKKDIFDNEEFKFHTKTDGKLVVTEGVLYPLSLEKITRMYKGAIDNGFASYAEA